MTMPQRIYGKPLKPASPVKPVKPVKSLKPVKAVRPQPPVGPVKQAKDRAQLLPQRSKQTRGYREKTFQKAMPNPFPLR